MPKVSAAKRFSSILVLAALSSFSLSAGSPTRPRASGNAALRTVNAAIRALPPRIGIEIEQFLNSPRYDTPFFQEFAAKISGSASWARQHEPTSPRAVDLTADASEFARKVLKPEEEQDVVVATTKMRVLAVVLEPMLSQEERADLSQAVANLHNSLSPKSQKNLELYNKMFLTVDALGISRQMEAPDGSPVPNGSHQDVGERRIPGNWKLQPTADLAWAQSRGFLDRNRALTLDDIKEMNEFKIHHPEDGIHEVSDRDREHGAGQFRTGSINIGATGMRTIEGEKVHREMEAFARWLNQRDREVADGDAEALAAEAFLRLIVVHPFDDGSGRSSRLLLNTLLLRHGKPAIRLDLLDWDRGPYDYAPGDVNYLAFLLREAGKGRSMKGWNRYSGAAGNIPGTQELYGAKSVTAGQFLDWINDYLMWDPPNEDIVARVHGKAGLTPEQHHEFLRLLEIGARRALNPKTRERFEGLKKRFSRLEQP